MRKKILLLLLLFPIIYYYRNSIYRAILQMTQHHQRLDEKKIESPRYYLINVLDKKEFDDAHIKGSIHVPCSQVGSFLNSLENKEIPIIFYCSNYFCTASDAAAKMAINRGFKSVYVYKGGMAEWYQTSLTDKSFEYEGSAEAEYLQIVILPQEDVLDSELDIIDDENIFEDQFKIISINNLQKFLKEGILIK